MTGIFSVILAHAGIQIGPWIGVRLDGVIPPIRTILWEFLIKKIQEEAGYRRASEFQ
jgi:hypothetical protein